MCTNFVRLWIPNLFLRWIPDDEKSYMCMDIHMCINLCAHGNNIFFSIWADSVAKMQLHQNQPTKRWRSKCNISLMYIPRGYCYIIIIIIIKTKFIENGLYNGLLANIALHSFPYSNKILVILCIIFIVFLFFTYHTMEMMSKSMEHWSHIMHIFLFLFLHYLHDIEDPPAPRSVIQMCLKVSCRFAKLSNHAHNVSSLK